MHSEKGQRERNDELTFMVKKGTHGCLEKINCVYKLFKLIYMREKINVTCYELNIIYDRGWSKDIMNWRYSPFARFPN